MSDTNPFVGKAVDAEAAGEPVVEVAVTADDVPAGSSKEVLDWVGEDKDRAQKALDAEHAKGDDARKGLTADLEKLVGE